MNPGQSCLTSMRFGLIADVRKARSLALAVESFELIISSSKVETRGRSYELNSSVQCGASQRRGEALGDLLLSDDGDSRPRGDRDLRAWRGGDRDRDRDRAGDREVDLRRAGERERRPMGERVRGGGDRRRGGERDLRRGEGERRLGGDRDL